MLIKTSCLIATLYWVFIHKPMIETQFAFAFMTNFMPEVRTINT